MMNVNDLDERDDTNDSSVGTPGDGMDGRATMVPPSGLNYVSTALHSTVGMGFITQNSG